MQVSRLALVGVLAALASASLQAQCEILKLIGPPPAPAGSRFGFSVTLDGDVLAVGKPSVEGPVPSGSVDVFQRSSDGSAWTFAGTLVPSDSASVEGFGDSVAVDGDRIVVGAIHAGLLSAEGTAYVFERQADGAWLETAKLLPPEGAFAFGWAVDLEGDRIVVGAKGVAAGDGKGRVVVFERQDGSWVRTATLKPSIAAPGDGFGASLDLEGERLVVGAPYAWVGGTSFKEGLAFVYELQPLGSAWLQKAVLAPEDLTDGDQFGRDVALDGDRVVVGAPLYDSPYLTFVGAAYVFDHLDGAWTQTAKLSPGDAPLLSQFGWSLDVEGGRIAVGARTDADVASSAGAVYLFEEQPSGGWLKVEKLHGSGLEAGDTFGNALDLEGSELLVGAPFLWALIGHPGQAFLFDLEPEGPSLIADAPSVALSTGGAQGLQLGGCAAHAGDVYALAGSASGTSPGFALGPHLVALNPDVYFHFLLQHPNQPPLAGSLGVLDAWGRGEASFALPAGLDPALAGLVLHHAYAVLDAATLQVEAVSKAVPVALVP